MDNLRLIIRCAQLIQTGHAQELDDAVTRIENSIHTTPDLQTDADIASMGCGGEETKTSAITHSAEVDLGEPVPAAVIPTDCDGATNTPTPSSVFTGKSTAAKSITTVRELVNKSPDMGGKKVALSLPTLYGTVTLLKSNDPAADLEEFDALLPCNFCAAPVLFKDDNIIFAANEAATNADALILWDTVKSGSRQTWTDALGCVNDIDYVIPLDQDALQNNKGFPGLACDNMKSVVDTVRTMIENEPMAFRMPEIGWKITNPGMKCRATLYRLKEWSIYDGVQPIELHKCGYHYATAASELETWWKTFDPLNEAYLIQVGPNCIKDTNTNRAVTDRMILLHRIPWADIP